MLRRPFSDFFKRRKGQVQGFHARMSLDTNDVKVVDATLDGKPVFWAVGLSEKSRRELEAKGALSVLPTVSAEAYSRSDKELGWTSFFNPKNMPGFIPKEMIKDTMAGTISTVSGAIAYSGTLDVRPYDQAAELEKAIRTYLKAVLPGTTRTVIIKKRQAR